LEFNLRIFCSFFWVSWQGESPLSEPFFVGSISEQPRSIEMLAEKVIFGATLMKPRSRYFESSTMIPYSVFRPMRICQWTTIFLGFLSILFLASPVFSQTQTPANPRSISESAAVSNGPRPPKVAVRYSADLTQMNHDQILVRVIIPEQNQKTVRFAFPKIVPGIYGAENYGRFISKFQALDKDHHPLPTKRVTKNIFEISNAENLHQISYLVDDCFEKIQAANHSRKPGADSKIQKASVTYKSAGSCFDSGQRFVINNHCLFGYISGKEHHPVEVDLKFHQRLLSSTSLKSQVQSNTDDATKIVRYFATSYYQLVDGPIVIGQGTKERFQVGKTTITVTVFSQQKLGSASHFCRILQPLMQAQARYMGGNLPVDRYSFLLVWDDGKKNEFLGDGLEHSQSTLNLLKGRDVVQGTELVRSICAHEFFHILIPLTLKSKEIAHYNFNNPKQSRHLWLYEGMTEYATIHMPAVEGLVAKNQILRDLRTKIRMSKNFAADRSLTHLSQFAIENQDQYYNFYLKGTLLCFCLDIYLLKKTDGRWNCRKLVAALGKKYGKDQPFEDDQLFDEIAKLTVPEIRDWFKKYVEGTAALPLKETLDSIGIQSSGKSGRLRWSKNPNEQQSRLRSLWLQKTSTRQVRSVKN